MNKSLNVLLAALLTGGAAIAAVQPAAASAISAQQLGRELQQEAVAMPMGSPQVDRNAKPDDPVPQLTTPAQRTAWDRAESHELRHASIGMPMGSPPVDRNAPAADPLPKATTPAQRQAQSAAEQQFLQQEATP